MINVFFNLSENLPYIKELSINNIDNKQYFLKVKTIVDHLLKIYCSRSKENENVTLLDLYIQLKKIKIKDGVDKLSLGIIV